MLRENFSERAIVQACALHPGSAKRVMLDHLEEMVGEIGLRGLVCPTGARGGQGSDVGRALLAVIAEQRRVENRGVDWSGSMVALVRKGQDLALKLNLSWAARTLDCSDDAARRGFRWAAARSPWNLVAGKHPTIRSKAAYFRLRDLIRNLPSRPVTAADLPNPTLMPHSPTPSATILVDAKATRIPPSAPVSDVTVLAARVTPPANLAPLTAPTRSRISRSTHWHVTADDRRWAVLDQARAFEAERCRLINNRHAKARRLDIARIALLEDVARIGLHLTLEQRLQIDACQKIDELDMWIIDVGQARTIDDPELAYLPAVNDDPDVLVVEDHDVEPREPVTLEDLAEHWARCEYSAPAAAALTG